MKRKKSRAMYGISRVDDPKHYTHAWRVSLTRRGKKLIRNFPDKRHGSKAKALRLAKEHRDFLVSKYPPISRREFSETLRRHNTSGFCGVYRYGKSYRLADGTKKTTWYWEANWPTTPGESRHLSFSVSEYGEVLARQLAIEARKKGLTAVEGIFWASARGA